MLTWDVTKACPFVCTPISVNYCLFTHSDVSYTFNGENDNVMLELHRNK